MKQTFAFLGIGVLAGHLQHCFHNKHQSKPIRDKQWTLQATDQWHYEDCYGLTEVNKIIWILRAQEIRFVARTYIR